MGAFIFSMGREFSDTYGPIITDALRFDPERKEWYKLARQDLLRVKEAQPKYQQACLASYNRLAAQMGRSDLIRTSW